MATRKYLLKYEEALDKWVLKNAANNKSIKAFATKKDATRAGVLKKLLGAEGGWVRISTRSGVFESERMFPGR